MGIIQALNWYICFDSEIPLVDIYPLRMTMNVGQASALECPCRRQWAEWLDLGAGAWLPGASASLSLSFHICKMESVIRMPKHLDTSNA